VKSQVGVALRAQTNFLLATAGVAALMAPLLVGVVATPRLRAQATPAGLLQFDVASIKPNKSGTSFFLIRVGDSGRFAATNATLRDLIAFAYPLKGPLGHRFSSDDGGSHLMPGLPNWSDSERFDIEAKTEGETTPGQKRLMLQSLLADRFKLAVHWETRQLPVFALVLDKPGKFGPQLRPHADNPKCLDPSAGTQQPSPGAAPLLCDNFQWEPGHARGDKQTMGDLAEVLDNYVNRVVVDKTGLPGTFDMTLEFAPELAGSPTATDSSDLPDIFTALKEQLGLKLESTTGPEDVLVIDHVEQPSPN
jgi:uncharacterized protein (TIGR03435 family)